MTLQLDLFADPAPVAVTSGDSPGRVTSRPEPHEPIAQGDRVVMLATRHKGRTGVVTEVDAERLIRVTLDGDGHRLICWRRQLEKVDGENLGRLATDEAFAPEAYTYSSPGGCPPVTLYDEPHDPMRRYRQVADEFRGVRIAREMLQEEGGALPDQRAVNEPSTETVKTKEQRVAELELTLSALRKSTSGAPAAYLLQSFGEELAALAGVDQIPAECYEVIRSRRDQAHAALVKIRAAGGDCPTLLAEIARCQAQMMEAFR